MRYLGPAAFTAASLVLLLAADPAGLATESAAAAPPPTAAPPLVLAATLVRTPPAKPRARRKPKPKRTVLRDPAAGRGRLRPADTYAGPAFDACSAPPLDTMRTWRTDSPYGAVGIYVSGDQRGCGQSRLTPAWVQEVRRLGWKMLPVTVGLQAPCSTDKSKPKHIDPAHAVQQGRDEAAQALNAMRTLGFAKGSPVYLDMEAYPAGDPACGQGVVDFVLGWTQTLHGAGYLSGFYSSLDSGIADLSAANRAGEGPLPDAIWYAHWDDHANVVDGAGALGVDLWPRHQRIHQYHGDVTETFGEATLAIDRDEVDGPVAD